MERFVSPNSSAQTKIPNPVSTKLAEMAVGILTFLRWKTGQVWRKPCVFQCLRLSGTRLARFPVDLVPQGANLLYVMQSVHQVELSPLRSGEWAEEGMVENFCAQTELLLAASDGLIHFHDLGSDLGGNLLRRQAPRLRVGWGCASGRQVAEAEYDEGLSAIFPRRLRRLRVTCVEDTAESLCSAGVGEIQMLEDFGSAPFLRGMPS